VPPRTASASRWWTSARWSPSTRTRSRPRCPRPDAASRSRRRPRTAGFGAELVATVQELCFLDLEAPILRLAGFDTPYPMPLIENDYIPGPDRIFDAIRRTVEF
jgi:hypothetical protein